jgi:hypothetical protein
VKSFRKATDADFSYSCIIARQLPARQIAAEGEDMTDFVRRARAGKLVDSGGRRRGKLSGKLQIVWITDTHGGRA